MNKTLLFVLIMSATLLTACNQEQANEQVTQTQEETYVYGQEFDDSNLLSVTQFLDSVSNQDSVEATITGEIVESCQSKGCWMDLRLADDTKIKVTFRDYGFFVPAEDLAGKAVTIHGTAKREVISVEDQRHYAEDAGKTPEEIKAITKPREELRFVANGVKFIEV